MLVLAGCFEIKVPVNIVKDPQEEIDFYKGPKFHGGCFKIVEKKSPYVGCTFASTQGSMFIADYRRTKETRGSWHVIVNQKIRCLYDADSMGPFVKETWVKKFRCPEKFLH
jgi:hypothetical protein